MVSRCLLLPMLRISTAHPVRYAPGVGRASQTPSRSSTPASAPAPRCAIDGSTAHRRRTWTSGHRYLHTSGTCSGFSSGAHNPVRARARAPPQPRTHRLHEHTPMHTPMHMPMHTPMHTPCSHEQRHGVILEQIGQVDKELCGIGAIYDAVIARERHRHLLHHADHAVLLEHGSGR